MADKQQYSSFFVDELFFGVEVEKVQEVMSAAAVTLVPLAPPVVRGLINLRGQIVTAIDLRRCLGLAEQQSEKSFVNLIIYTNDGCASLLVDQVGDVLGVDENDFESIPATLQGRSRELIRGAYKLDGRLLLVLDTEKVMDTTKGSLSEDGRRLSAATSKNA
jgi:purine-binding chemotaxis protein CheW